MSSIAPATAAAASSPEAMVQRRFDRSIDVPTRFFTAHAASIAGACQALAARFERGGRLLVIGTGAEASDAQHVAVEFVHPVLVGKRALPALALGAAAPHTIAAIGEDADIALALGWSGLSDASALALQRARSRGMLTLALTGGAAAVPHVAAGADFVFHVPCDDVLVVQETHETLYHVLWELVHLFFQRSAAR